MDFGTCPTDWYIEGDLPNQVAVSTGSTVYTVLDIEMPIQHVCYSGLANFTHADLGSQTQ